MEHAEYVWGHIIETEEITWKDLAMDGQTGLSDILQKYIAVRTKLCGWYEHCKIFFGDLVWKGKFLSPPPPGRPLFHEMFYIDILFVYVTITSSLNAL
jgi:hypothetical protein